MFSVPQWPVAVLFAAARMLLVSAMLLVCRASAADSSVTDFLATGEAHETLGETQLALAAYQAADQLSPHSADILIHLAKMYCDSMHGATNKTEARVFAEKALACGLDAVKAEPQSAKAHVCVAVCYAKQFPYSDNQAKVNYSRQIKTEAEKGIELDPKFDLAYHMLGRWNFEVSSMNFFVKSLVRIAYGGLPKASREAAIVNFKKAIELAPNRIIHHLQLARLYHVTGQENLVPDELKKCAELTPTDKDDKDAQGIALKISKDGRWPDEF